MKRRVGRAHFYRGALLGVHIHGYIVTAREDARWTRNGVSPGRLTPWGLLGRLLLIMQTVPEPSDRVGGRRGRGRRRGRDRPRAVVGGYLAASPWALGLVRCDLRLAQRSSLSRFVAGCAFDWVFHCCEKLTR